ncbi:hypothetical protein [Georgenia sp. SYP-B2076]|uniref:hypothetical protein n=1 Tax=Georgenia sp. SYP-B2076 TaxID=2495881 RepID=UPI000F8DF37C|nr:hypothetical protein [Georgenia sp. SYP-B2076]
MVTQATTVRRPWLLAVCATLTLAACSGGDPTAPPVPDGPQRAVVELAEVELPGETRSPSAASWDWTLVPADGARAALAVGVVEDPGSPAAVGIWRLGPDGTPTESRLAVPGHVEAVSAAATGDVVAVAGRTWDGAHAAGFISVAPHRRAFASVPLADDARDVRFDDVAVVGPTIIAVGEDVHGTARAVVVDVDDGGAETGVVALPPVGDGEEVTLTSVTGRDARVVVTAHVDRPGLPMLPVSYVSDDGGLTWDGPHAIAGTPRSTTAGAAFTGTDYVVTGSRFDERRGALSPAAWSSPDGRTWLAEDVEVDAAWAEQREDISLGRPLAAGPVTAAAFAEHDRYLVATERVAPGRWVTRDLAKPVPWSHAEGMTWHAPDGHDWFLVGFAGSAEIQRLSPTGHLTARPVVGHVPHARVGSVHPTGVVVGVDAARPYFRETENRWETGTTAEPMVLDGSAARRQTWGPDGLARYADVASLSDGAGTTVLFGSGREQGEDQLRTVGWVRKGDGAGWEPVTGVTGEEFVFVHRVTRADGAWYALGRVARSLDRSDPRTAMIWTSTDGREWRPMAGGYAAEGQESSVRDVCSLTDGELVAVGWTDGSDGRTAAMWRLVDGAWARGHTGPGRSAFS